MDAAPEPPRDDARPPGLEERVFQRLLLAADHLLQGEIAILRVADLTFPQYSVLRILREARPDRLSCRAIGQRMITRDSDMTRLLDRLAARQLVWRSRDEADRRVITATISDAGLALLRRLDGPVERVHRQQLAHLSTEELRGLDTLARRVRVGA